MRIVRALLKGLLPMVVLAVSAGYAFHTVANRPDPKRHQRPEPITEVEVVTVARTTYDVVAYTRGTVQPRTESTLIPEVTGRVVEISPRLRAGEFFDAGDSLLKIDPRDYQTEKAIAEASLIQARMSLQEEQARAAQAEREWKRLGETGKPDALVLRKPQLTSARAAVRIAQARLARARLTLERTEIKAPYAGRVLEQNVDIGQYVSPGTVLARVYAVDYVEVRLPLANRELEFVDVPELYRSEAATSRKSGPKVTLSARIGRRLHQWDGRLIRAEGSIDTTSRQLFVIAQVDDPYGKGPANRPPLKVGQFVEAAIEGRTLTDIFVIPRDALRAGDQVLLVGDDDRLVNRKVEVRWSDREHAVISQGLNDGDRLVVTAIGVGVTGTQVRIASRRGTNS